MQWSCNTGTKKKTCTVIIICDKYYVWHLVGMLPPLTRPLDPQAQSHGFCPLVQALHLAGNKYHLCHFLPVPHLGPHLLWPCCQAPDWTLDEGMQYLKCLVPVQEVSSDQNWMRYSHTPSLSLHHITDPHLLLDQSHTQALLHLEDI